MFDNFPYTNFHEMNLDWMIKIAKDFLDQYTHIQETITQGLEDLDTKAQQLEALLQAWYDQHSQDIADQLADALADLNEWYTQHQSYLDQTLQDNITRFNQVAEAKAAETIASIPSDYTALSNEVNETIIAIGRMQHPGNNIVTDLIYTQGGYYNTTTGNSFRADPNWGYSALIPCEEGKTYYLNTSDPMYIGFFDSEQVFISGVAATTATAPTGANFIQVSIPNNYGGRNYQKESILTVDSIYKDFVDTNTKAIEGTRTIYVNESNSPDYVYFNDVNLDVSFAHDITISNLSNYPGNFRIYPSWAGNNVASKSSEMFELQPGQSYTFRLDAQFGQNEWEPWYTSAYIGVTVRNYNTQLFRISIDEIGNNYIKDLREKRNIVLCNANSTGNGIFPYIQNAIDYCKQHYNVLTDPVTIYIMAGTYIVQPIDSRHSVLNKGANKISLIGENRDTTIITLNSTPAHNNKIIEHGGESVVANLTLNNLWTEDGSTISYDHNAYCIHNDYGFNVNYAYKTVVENCILYSEAFAPVGAGLHHNQTQVYRNIVATFNSLDTRPQGYNQWAPIYVHSPGNSADEGNCALVIEDCTCIAKKGTKAIALPFGPVGSGTQTYATIPVSIRRTIAVTTGQTISDVSSAYDLQMDSELNSAAELNYSNYH